ncbi:MAG: Mrp/NBP35 family ATP-binding protein [Lachnospirales bacterium]
MGNCSSCPSKGRCGKQEDSCGIKVNEKNKIKNVIGVMSGKGGVGKSTISVSLAKELNSQGYKVGILDADITGPSVVRLLGIDKNVRAMGTNNQEIIPVTSKEGIKVISLNLLIKDENQPVIWRGSLLSNCVNQFWNDVLWEELDYLIIDMPPGTGDVTLTVMQSIPLTGLIIVSVPQSMISMIVTKSINMAKKMGIKIYGIVENMSYILCPHCNEKIYIYDKEETNNLLNDNNLKLLAELPTTKDLANIYKGSFEQCDNIIKEQFKNIVAEIIK